jgi:hypothetical protein
MYSETERLEEARLKPEGGCRVVAGIHLCN